MEIQGPDPRLKVTAKDASGNAAMCTAYPRFATDEASDGTDDDDDGD